MKIQDAITALRESIETNHFTPEQHNWVVADVKRMVAAISTDNVVSIVPAPPFPTLFAAETAIALCDTLKVYNGRNERIIFQRFTKNEWEQLYLNDLCK